MEPEPEVAAEVTDEKGVKDSGGKELSRWWESEKETGFHMHDK